MKRYVTDTQCLLWHFTDDRRLPKPARTAFKASEDGRAQVLIPSIVLAEAVFLAQRQRVSEAVLAELLALSEDLNATFAVTPLDMAVVRALYDFGPAVVPELPDRIIAATARALNLSLLTTDPLIEESGLVKVAK
jgi:PIN domain nuclease of toxin-antitoxin system